MHRKIAVLDIAGGLADRAGATGLGGRLQAAHASVGRRLDRFLQQDFPASTAGVHIPMPSFENGRLGISPWTTQRQEGVRRLIAHNPEAFPAFFLPVPGLESSYLGAKALARRAVGVPLSGVPGTTTSFRSLAAPAVSAVRGVADSARRSLRDFMMQENTMPLKTGSAPEYRGRGREGTFSTAFEEANIQSGNAVLDGLFARKAEMAARTEKQLSGLLKNKSYGRSRALGPTAAEAASYLERARASGALE